MGSDISEVEDIDKEEIEGDWRNVKNKCFDI
jgi:hypothetical protein